MQLTPRQQQILSRLAQGDKRAAIAADLSIHVRTVDFHILKIRRRTGLSGPIAQLVLWYAARVQEERPARPD